MKFFSVAVMSVLFCAAAVHAVPFGVPYAMPGVPYAAPALTADDLRAKLTCIDGVFDKLVSEYSELEAYHSELKAKVNEINPQLDSCEAVENSDECVSEVVKSFVSFVEEIGAKLIEENKETAATTAIAIMLQCD